MDNRKRSRHDAGLSPNNRPNNDNNFIDQLDNSINTTKKAIDQLSAVLPTATPEQLPILQAMLSGLSASFDNCCALINGLKSKMASDPVEDKERSRSVVLINVPESNSALPSEHVQHDKQLITRILDKLGIEVAPIHYRMGRPNSPAQTGRARLIKCVFPASVFLRLTLGRWKVHRDEIRSDPQLAKMLIRPSLSAEERARERDERAKIRAANNGTDGSNKFPPTMSLLTKN